MNQIFQVSYKMNELFETNARTDSCIFTIASIDNGSLLPVPGKQTNKPTASETNNSISRYCASIIFKV